MRQPFLRVRTPGAAACALLLLVAGCDNGSPDDSITGPRREAGNEAPVHATSSSTTVAVSDLSVSSGRTYVVVDGGMASGARTYTDRTYVFDAVPDLVQGQTYIQTANGDQTSSGNDSFLSFTIDRQATVYVAHNDSIPPAWLRTGFSYTGQTLRVKKSRQILTFHLFEKQFPAGSVVLGSNREGGSVAGMYSVIIKPVVDTSNNQPPGAFNSISAGFHHSCGVTPSGAAYCWGRNDSGQLGNGAKVGTTTPVAVAGGIAFASVSGGASHTCGLTPSGAAYCWGRNNYGQLGDGTNTDRTQPVVVASGLTFASLSAGQASTCGLSTDGRAYCWGQNNQGQLGDGNTSNRSKPGPVAGGYTFVYLNAGFNHSCGLVEGGAAYCWGRNYRGQLGDGTTTDSRRPVAVQGGLTFLTVDAAMAADGSQNHSCGIATNGRAYCWGDNWHNQLGINDTRDYRTTPQAVAGVPTSFSGIATGGDHTCAITPAGEAWCWGDGKRGQLGSGSATDFNVPKAVSGGLAFRSLGMGWDHTCAVTTSGDAYCWGYNGYGQLGLGDTANRARPKQILFP